MILALSTPDSTTHVWLFADAQAPVPLTELEWESGRALSDQLLSHLQTFLADHDAAFTDLEGIVIFSGPGSFTSLRIGHTVANALADSLGIPIVGAMGEDWLTQSKAVLATAKSGQPALPHYGAEANITKPKS
jgi:tRNA threonylcarbamoyladenosine biosynthesis protein TsaB